MIYTGSGTCSRRRSTDACAANSLLESEHASTARLVRNAELGRVGCSVCRLTTSTKSLCLKRPGSEGQAFHGTGHKTDLYNMLRNQGQRKIANQV